MTLDNENNYIHTHHTHTSELVSRSVSLPLKLKTKNKQTKGAKKVCILHMIFFFITCISHELLENPISKECREYL